MKKRILSILLAVITVMQVFPVFALPIIAEDGDDSVIGKIGRLNITSGTVYMYEEVNNGGGDGRNSIINVGDMPELFVILDTYYAPQAGASGRTYYKLGQLEGGEYHTAFDVTPWINGELVEIVEDEPKPDDGYIHGKVDISCDEAVGGVVTLEKGGKVHAFTKLDAEISDNAKYQWQMKLPDGRWAAIMDYILSYAVLSEALLVNNMAEDGVATLRCIVTDGDKQYASDELGLTVAKPAPQIRMMAAAPAIASRSIDANTPAVAAEEEEFPVTIRYVFARLNENHLQTEAAHPYTHHLYDESQVLYDITVPSPFVMGYTACVLTNDTTNPAAIEFDGDGDGNVEYYLPQPSWEFHKISLSSPANERHITIYYVPLETNFVVEHYYQNLNDDGYSLAGMDLIKTKYCDDPVGEGLARNAYGYKPLFYDATTKVAGNGNTVIEIYYDRIYYLVDFELSDGYGLMPYYVRYGAQVMLTEPTRPGYSFVNPWQLDRVYTKKDDDDKVGTSLDLNDPNISAAYKNKNANALITVEHNLNYTAKWTEGDTSYTIVYWLENTDSTDSTNKDNYDVWYTYNQKAVTGENTIVGADNIKKYITTGTALTDVNNTYPYLTYQSGLTDTTSKVVEGNGSTTVNVYYSRKQYTLKFYYAIENTSTKTYHVIGGSTYYFGTNATGTAQTDEIVAMRQYASGTRTGETGRVTALPTLNDRGKSRGYTVSSDPDGSYKYHYISFSARYGADISNLWPCGVFNESTISFKHSYWAGGKAMVSAWNGEYRVRYTQDGTVNNGNQTIKGNYTQLDANILWNNTSVTDTTIAYACFWEGGANKDWSVPELYRYKIWLPTIPGETYTQQTITYNNVTYYLADVYDTCDDSTAKKQTHPAIVGYNKAESISFSYHVAGAQGDTEADTQNSLGISNTERTEITNMVGTGKTYKAAAVMNYFYTRVEYSITFNDMHSPAPPPTNIPYGTVLTNYNNPPAYPSSLEEGECRFVGWYIDEACQMPFDFNTTMPAKNIQLYAKWETTTHNVKVYRQESEKDSTATGKLLLDKTVEFGTQIQESELADYAKPNENYAFGGWFYRDEKGEEHRYDFNTMVVKRSYVIYAKWIKNVPIPYTVKYVAKINGEKIEIAKTESGIALEGVKKTFTAKTDTDLYKDYRMWYFPDERYITHEMKANEAENVIEFVYHSFNTITYTVTHVFNHDKFADYFADHRTSFTYSQKFTITEGVYGEDGKFQPIIVEAFTDIINKDAITAKAISEGASAAGAEKIWLIILSLTPDFYIQEMLLTKDPHENVMTFVWEDVKTTSMYQVVHYVQNLGSKTYSIFNTETYYVKNDANLDISAKWANMYGFTRAAFKINGEAQSDKYLASDDITVKLGEDVPMKGKILELYYDRAMYTYTVHHYAVGTTKELRPDETDKAAFETEILTAGFAKTIKGYTYYVDNVPSHTLGANNYEIIVFYSPETVNYNFQHAVAGRGDISRPQYTGKVGTAPDPDKASSTATPLDGYRFVGWFLDTAGTQPVTQYAELSEDGMTITPRTPTPDMANHTITFYALFEPTTRTFKNSGVADKDANQAFIYRIQGADSGNSNVDVTFVIVGNNEVTLAMLPFGKYKVTVMDWAWRYESAPAVNFNNSKPTGSTMDLTLDTTGDVIFDYAGVTPTDQWLTSDSSNIPKATP